jgi:hypothetical protein
MMSESETSRQQAAAISAALAENGKLKELLAQHQEIDRLQGNRILDLMRELGKAEAKLRAEISINSTLRTQLHAAQKGRA